jgi:hypothetical protein
MESKNIYQKLSDAKSEFSPLLKDSKNPFFKSKYASLNALMDVIEQPFSSNGLLLLQPIIEGMVITKIIDIDSPENVLTSEMKLPENLDSQKLGAAITYFRRYTLQSLLGLNALDDDAEATIRRVKKTENKDTRKIINEENFSDSVKWMQTSGTWEELDRKYRISNELRAKLELELS